MIIKVPATNHLNHNFVERVLQEHYTQSHRHYHSWVHICELFKVAARIPAVRLSRTQELALLFHDAVYIPGSKNNEEASAWLQHVMVNNALTCGENPFNQIVDEVVCGRIVAAAGSIILDTAEHVPHHERGEWVLDLDLSGLADYDHLVMSTESIFLEYRPIINAPAEKRYEIFIEGRASWIEKFLTRPTIYHSKEFSAFELPAREALAKHLKDLR